MRSIKQPHFFNYPKNLFLFFFGGLKNFTARLSKSITLMSSSEKFLAGVFLIAATIMIYVKFNDYYENRTKLVPKEGGVYIEAVIGELTQINPVLAVTDNEKSVSELIFSGLIRSDKDNSVIPDVADKWEISPDQEKYTFTLKNNVSFHDGNKLTADDVVYTIERIKSLGEKSPLYKSWKDVEVSTEGGDKVVFTLPRPYGPFIFNCDFGILPSYMPPDEFNKKIVGSGKFRYSKSNIKSDKITKLILIRNEDYYRQKPLLIKVEMGFFSDSAKAETAFRDQDVKALSGMKTDQKKAADFSFPTSKKLGLILNLRNDKLKDKTFRAKLLSDAKFDTKVLLSLTTFDSPEQRGKAEEIKKQFLNRNIDLSINYYNPVKMKDILDAKNYELLLYGFDFGHDRDPYTFWHSSQIDVLNFAGWSDKASDTLLEDARMTTDTAIRNAKYDQFFSIVKENSLAMFYDPILYNFYIYPEIKGIEKSQGVESSSRYNGIENWFMKENRVKR